MAFVSSVLLCISNFERKSLNALRQKLAHYHHGNSREQRVRVVKKMVSIIRFNFETTDQSVHYSLSKFEYKYYLDNTHSKNGSE